MPTMVAPRQVWIIFGRAAVGAGSLPRNVAVEVEAIFEID